MKGTNDSLILLILLLPPPIQGLSHLLDHTQNLGGCFVSSYLIK